MMTQMPNRMAERERSVLLVIDLQESYVGKMFEEARVVSASERVIQAAEGSVGERAFGFCLGLVGAVSSRASTYSLIARRDSCFSVQSMSDPSIR